MDRSNILTLKVGGKIYEGWKSVSVRTGLEQIAGTYELAITERWPNQPKDWSIPPGELCEIQIGDDTVISGYVDSVSVSYDANSHDIRVTGRDRTGRQRPTPGSGAIRLRNRSDVRRDATPWSDGSGRSAPEFCRP